jgi:hypothetical protein
VDEITSADLCDALAADDGGPWAAYGRSEKPITPVGVARLLKHFRIRSKDIRNGQIVRKTYEKKAFADAWARYLPPERPIQAATPQQPNNANDLGSKSTRYNGTAVADEKPTQTVDKSAMLRRSGSETSPSMKRGEI